MKVFVSGRRGGGRQKLDAERTRPGESTNDGGHTRKDTPLPGPGQTNTSQTEAAALRSVRGTGARPQPGLPRLRPGVAGRPTLCLSRHWLPASCQCAARTRLALPATCLHGALPPPRLQPAYPACTLPAHCPACTLPAISPTCTLPASYPSCLRPVRRLLPSCTLPAHPSRVLPA